MKKHILLSIIIFALFSLKLTATPMILHFDTTLSDGLEISLPLFETVNVTINWGDDNIENITSAGEISHIYEEEGSKIRMEFFKWMYQAHKMEYGSANITPTATVTFNGQIYSFKNIIPSSVTEIKVGADLDGTIGEYNVVLTYDWFIISSTSGKNKDTIRDK